VRATGCGGGSAGLSAGAGRAERSAGPDTTTDVSAAAEGTRARRPVAISAVCRGSPLQLAVDPATSPVENCWGVCMSLSVMLNGFPVQIPEHISTGTQLLQLLIHTPCCPDAALFCSLWTFLRTGKHRHEGHRANQLAADDRPVLRLDRRHLHRRQRHRPVRCTKYLARHVMPSTSEGRCCATSAPPFCLLHSTSLLPHAILLLLVAAIIAFMSPACSGNIFCPCCDFAAAPVD